MIGEQGLQPGAQRGQGLPLIEGEGGEVRIDLARHSAAFIWKPSSILSEGATG